MNDERKHVTMLVGLCVLLLVTVSIAGCTNANPTASPTTETVTPTAQATTTTQSSNVQSYTGPFAGSKNSNVYHLPWCTEAKKINPENRVTFNTAADAQAAGYRPCEICRPPSSAGASVITPTPTPAPPTPTPKPLQCYHVEIIIMHNKSIPCNHCAMMNGMLTERYAGNPYFSVVMQNDPTNSNTVIGVVRETGETQSLPFADVNAIEAWATPRLICV